MEFLIGKFSEMGAGTEKEQLGLVYGQNRPLQLLVSSY